MSVTIFVAGSLNADLVVRVDRLPAAGMTVAGMDLQRFCGGKGANQAVAAARLGGHVRMIGRVGEDEAGRELVGALAASGVDASHVTRTPSVPTGVALIAVQADGQNHIIVAAGANARLTLGDIEAGLHDAREGDFLLLQLESPIAVVEAAASAARSRGLTVILDPAPASVLPSSLVAAVAVITPNESEALALIGEAGSQVEGDDVFRVAARVKELGVATVIMKCGARGAVVVTGDRIALVPAPVVEAADTTAAGDTFNGALAVALAEGQSMHEAVAFANTAAARSVKRPGAQASMPWRAELALP